MLISILQDFGTIILMVVGALIGGGCIYGFLLFGGCVANVLIFGDDSAVSHYVNEHDRKNHI